MQLYPCITWYQVSISVHRWRTAQWPRNKGKNVFPSQYLTNQRLHNAPIHFQLLALDAKHFVKLEGLGEGGGGLLLDGDLLGVGGVHHAVRALCLLGVV